MKSAMIKSCLFFAAAALFGASSVCAQSPPAKPACDSPSHRQFDFWVGYWDVYPTGKDNLVAHSLIEKLYDGCAIRENWMPLRNTGGGSLNSYDPDKKVWRQVWTDKDNGWGVFEGTFENGAMLLSGHWDRANGPGTSAVTRTFWTTNADGSVRQRGEALGDDGKTWQPAFDFTYKKSANSPPK
jgi:hypothetical protein